MKDKELEKYAKEWSIDTMVGQIYSGGMEFMVRDMTNEDAKDFKDVFVNEIESRLDKQKKEIIEEINKLSKQNENITAFGDGYDKALDDIIDKLK